MTTATSNKIALAFEGYWREPTRSSIPAKPGIYVVYAATFDASAKTVSLKRKLYIGESGDVNRRIGEHLAGSTGTAWKKLLKPGEVLAFNFAPVAATATRQRAEAALIYKYKPPANVEYKTEFPREWSPTTVTTSGKNALLDATLTVP